MKRIFDECQEFGVKVIFQILKTGFLTTFYRPEKRKEVVEKGRKRIQKDKKLGETEINILELISKNRKISIVQLASLPLGAFGSKYRSTEKNYSFVNSSIKVISHCTINR